MLHRRSLRVGFTYVRASVLSEAADLHALDIMDLGKPLQSLIRSWNIALQGLIWAFAGLAPSAGFAAARPVHPWLLDAQIWMAGSFESTWKAATQHEGSKNDQRGLHLLALF